jgi:hypothetical protein
MAFVHVQLAIGVGHARVSSDSIKILLVQLKGLARCNTSNETNIDVLGTHVHDALCGVVSVLHNSQLNVRSKEKCIARSNITQSR